MTRTYCSPGVPLKGVGPQGGGSGFSISRETRLYKKDALLKCCFRVRFTAEYGQVDQILKFQICRGLSRVAFKDMSKIVKSWSRHTKSVNVIKANKK